MSNVIASLKKKIKIILFLFVLFISLKVIAYRLPSELVRKNIEMSYGQLEEEGLYPQMFYHNDSSQFCGLKLDNWSDAIYLNVAYLANEKNVFKAIAGDFLGENPDGGGDPIQDLKYTLETASYTNGNGINENTYMRQWFGSQVIFRPLLCLFTLSEIRMIFQYLVILLSGISVMTIGKLGKAPAVSFLIGILSANIVIVGSSLNFIGAFLVVLTAAIIIPSLKWDFQVADFMIVIGGTTAFMDLFATPFLTFPMVTLLLIIKKNHSNQCNTLKQGFILLFQSAIGWLFGYVILWMGKWLLASVALNTNCFLDAFNEFVNAGTMRPDYGPQTTTGMIRESLRLNFSAIFPVNLLQILNEKYSIHIEFIIILLIILWVIVNFILYKKGYIKLNNNGYLFCVILMMLSPYVWYLFINAHSFVHFWFSYRSQCATICSVSLLLGTTWTKNNND